MRRGAKKLRLWTPRSKRIGLVLATGTAGVQFSGCTITPRPSPEVPRPSAERVVARPIERGRTTTPARGGATPEEVQARLKVLAEKSRGETLAKAAERKALAKADRPVQPKKGTSILLNKEPSISADYIDWKLRAGGSPAAGHGEAMVRWGRHYGVDPAFILAKFSSESNFGTKGVARTTKSVGNLRGTGPAGSYNGFRRYNTWEEGIRDFCRLMAETGPYLRAGRTTVEEIVPVYAPPSENPTGSIINRVNNFMGKYRNEHQRGLHLKKESFDRRAAFGGRVASYRPNVPSRAPYRGVQYA